MSKLIWVVVIGFVVGAYLGYPLNGSQDTLPKKLDCSDCYPTYKRCDVGCPLG